MLYVSNIVGDPSAKDGKGYISKLSLEGEIVNKEWATGLHAPKGMTMLDGKLYVTDVDALVVIDASGKISNRYPVKGAKFLNDPVAADNKILFTDSRDNKIHALENGKLSIWKESGMSKPNGLAYQNGKVLLASNNLEVVSQEGESEVLATGLDAGDGIGLVDDNSYLVSNWHGEVFYIERGKDKVKLLDTKDQKINTADITYIPEENLLLVPTFMDNRVVAYRLKR
ncbi:MAG: ATP-binding protein [Bacteroidetes bacterium]|nr:ATP-binding protein [Bacteroidota bacterium]